MNTTKTSTLDNVINYLSSAEVVKVATNVGNDLLTVASETAQASLYTVGAATKTVSVAATGARMGTEAVYNMLPESKEEAENMWNSIFESNDEEESDEISDEEEEAQVTENIEEIIEQIVIEEEVKSAKTLK